MKIKKMTTLLLASCIILGCFTGCSNGKSGEEQLSSGHEAAYIPVRNEYFDALSGSFDPDGKACEDFLNDAEEFTAEDILLDLNAIYFDGNEFMQFGKWIPVKEFYSGEYSVTGAGMVDLDYQVGRRVSMGRGEELYVDLKTKQSDMEVSSKVKFFLKEMDKANDFNYVIGESGLIALSDRDSYIARPYYNKVNESGDDWSHRFSDNDWRTPLFSKGDFLVAEQKGFFFEGDVSEKEFTIAFDDPNSNFRMKIEFFSDNTWKSEKSPVENEGRWKNEGKWKLRNDNLLVIYLPGDIRGVSAITALYLDFEDREIYVPSFVRCDDIIKYAKKYKADKD